MGCGCNGGRGIRRGQVVRLGNVHGGQGRFAASTRTTGPELRSLAAKKAVEQTLKEKSQGGLDKNRREIERKRRLLILNKLGRL